VIVLDSIFIDDTKLDAAAKKHLELDGVFKKDVNITIREYTEIQNAVKEIAENDNKIWVCKYQG
jgi:hypothetical protein